MSINLYKNKSGFSLVELMVVIAILPIVMGAIYGVFASVNRACINNEVNAEVMQHMRTSLEFMEQDIRMAGLDGSESADAGIEVATPSIFRFTADRNMDGTINTAFLADGIQEQDLERITYSYDAAGRQLEQCLYEETNDAWETVAENVINFQFTYFDEDDNPLAFPIADLSKVRTVQVSMTIEQPAGRAGPVSRTLTKRILCRNLGF
jgi:prepilin-type N-terminal cleavage/methylation domain-containing protein